MTTCTFCGEALDQNVVGEPMPAVHLHNRQGSIILSLHAECIKTVIAGLRYCESLVVH